MSEVIGQLRADIARVREELRLSEDMRRGVERRAREYRTALLAVVDGYDNDGPNRLRDAIQRARAALGED